MIGNMAEALSQEELEALHCWEPEDRVPGRPAMTEFRRGLRRHQALWRESNGHPVGSHPIVPRSGKPSRSVGSRLPLDYARATGASFLTPEARDAARASAPTMLKPAQDNGGRTRGGRAETAAGRLETHRSLLPPLHSS